jgi:hypothetical protein
MHSELNHPRFIILHVLFSFIVISLLASPIYNTSYAQKKTAKVSGVYRVLNEKRDGFAIWIVDGAAIRQDIYHEFVYGGNEQRYLFVPKGEIWIDNAISVEEYEYTVAHELNERKLMAKFGYTYAVAHDSSLQLELKMRKMNSKISKSHEKLLAKVSPTDCDGYKEIYGIEDSIEIKNIYLQPLGKRDSISIWVVDGSAVRRYLFPDFGFSGNDLAYHFIPNKEIWIDAQISCEETEFSIQCEMEERYRLSKGQVYDDAYENALMQTLELRKSKKNEASRKAAIILPKDLDRDTGTGNEK